MPSEQRVLVLDRRYESVGGTNMYLLSLIPALNDAGFEVHLGINQAAELNPLLEQIRDLGVSVSLLPIGTESARQAAECIEQLIESVGPSIVHVNCHAADMRKAINCLADRCERRFKSVFTMHGSVINECRNLAASPMRFLPWSYTRTALLERVKFLDFFDQLISVSRKNVEIVEKNLGVSSSRFRVIPNGVDIQRYKPNDKHCMGIDFSGPITIGTCARLSKEKRIDLLITAFSMLYAKYENVSLRIIGDGPCRGELEDLVERRGVASRTTFVGESHEIPRELQLIDVFAVTSDNEGLPYALLEALASGIPCVVSNVNELPIVVKDKEHGMVFEKGDAASCADKLEKLILDPEGLRKMGERARSLACSDYSQEASLHLTVELFETLHHQAS